MKSVIYINKGKLYSGARSYEWTIETLSSVFSSIRKNEKINEVRIVLGSDISYVVDFRLEDVSKSRREDILRIAKSWLPFVVTDESFDWKMVTLGESDLWAQVVAVEPIFLQAITDGVTKSGLKVEWLIPIGVVLGMLSIDNEAPILIKWRGIEELSVLAQNGLVDYVGKDTDEEVSSYAKQKWHLEVNPEQMLLTEDNFKFNDWVMSGRNKGDDGDVLGLNLFKRKSLMMDNVVPKYLENIVQGINSEITKTVNRTITQENETESGVVNGNNVWMIILGVASVIILSGIIWWSIGRNTTVIPTPIANEPVVTSIIQTSPVISQVVSPATISADLTSYKIQVLNGSGIIREADKTKNNLIAAGFLDITTGNSPKSEKLTLVSYKSGLPADVVSKIMDSLKNYVIGDVLFLANDSPYDLRIVIGKSVQ